jgi:hypothetical protein
VHVIATTAIRRPEASLWRSGRITAAPSERFTCRFLNVQRIGNAPFVEQWRSRPFVGNSQLVLI